MKGMHRTDLRDKKSSGKCNHGISGARNRDVIAVIYDAAFSHRGQAVSSYWQMVEDIAAVFNAYWVHRCNRKCQDCTDLETMSVWRKGEREYFLLTERRGGRKKDEKDRGGDPSQKPPI